MQSRDEFDSMGPMAGQRRDAFLPAVSRPMKDPPLGSRASAVDGRPSSQQGPGVSGAGFDDDYNEWELGIGDLIIDLDADIEKSNDPAMASAAAAAAAGGPTAAQAAPPPAQAAASSPPIEHQATVDKGLKMKIKRKNLAKHEIVKAQDTGSSPLPANSASSSAATKHSSSSSLSSSSSKGGSGRSGSHKKKRLENGASPPRLPPQCALGVTQGAPESPLPAPSSVVATAVTEQQQSANGVSPPSPVAEEVAAEEAASEAPLKKIKTECPESPSRSAVAATSGPVERRDSGVLCSSVGTITEPDCLGPCEPGTSVTLEGIVWQETEGGVLVVNVTWRGKTYVGTLLDCTRHDWAPPRFCESPTSDLDAKGGLPKGGRPKRARGDPEAANRGGCTPVQGKLRNGKGRRFAVPCSPAKGEGRRRTATRPPELELSPPDKKRARARGTPPTPEAPCSPALIPCPEPHCGKKYKHINGLRYHQSHAHGCGDAKGGEEETSDGGEEGSSPPSPTILPPALPVAVAPAAAPAAPEEPSPSPPVSVTVSIPTSQVFSFVPAAPRAASPPPVRALATPVCPPDSVPSAAPPSPPKAAPPVVAEPPGQAVVPQAASLDAVLRQHKRPHKKGKGRKSEGGPLEEAPEGPLPLAAAAAAETSLPLEQAPPNLEESVQSPAYSDISDDAAPLLEAAKDKEPPRGPPGELYGVYPYFGQPPYLLPGVQPPPEAKPPPPPNPAAEEEAAKKEGGVLRDKAPKEPSRDGPTTQEPPGKKPDFPQFPPYSLCAGGPYVGGGPPGYPFHEPYHVHMVDSSPSAFKEDKSGGKDAPGVDKGAPPPLDKNSPRVLPPHPRRNQSPEAPVPPKERLCKEEAKEEPKFSPYEPLYERRFLYLQDPPPAEAPPKEAPPTPKAPPPHPPKSRPPKEPKDKDGGGQKPTMETTGPPPPSNYAYLHPGYLPPHFPPHVAFESVYRGLPHYGGSPYLRFHVPAPEVPQQAPGPPVVGQVGGPQGPPKALDLLHQVSQHYSNHKIHELQERAVPSPSPHAGPGDRPPRGGPPEKGPPRGDPGPLAPLEAGPKGGGMPVVGVPLGGVPPQQQQGPGPGGGPPGPTQNPDGTSRSPPPQRHLHTHHHTHVGVGYPLYDPYGAMIASQQAAACAVAASSNLHPFVPK